VNGSKKSKRRNSLFLPGEKKKKKKKKKVKRLCKTGKLRFDHDRAEMRRCLQEEALRLFVIFVILRRFADKAD
jgi:hypothetical protein